jgi:hypothetical protein
VALLGLLSLPATHAGMGDDLKITDQRTKCTVRSIGLERAEGLEPDNHGGH